MSISKLWLCVLIVACSLGIPLKGLAKKLPDSWFSQMDNLSSQISHYVTGTNYWYVTPTLAWSNNTLHALRQQQLGMIRLGASAAYLARQPMALSRFLSVAEQLGATPLVEIDMLTTTPLEAASIVERINVEQQRCVVFWAIGNEPDLWERQGSEQIAQFALRWREYALAMKAVDPNIRLVGPDLGWEWRVAVGRDWLSPFMQLNGALLDVLSLHFYPSTSYLSPVSIENLLATSAEFDVELSALRAWLQHKFDRLWPIAVTEFNLTSNWEADDLHNNGSSFWAGLWSADVQIRMINQGIAIGLFWSTWGGKLSQLAPDNRPRSTYYAQRLFRHLQPLYVASEGSVDQVNLTASRNLVGTLLTVFATNKSAESQAIKLVWQDNKLMMEATLEQVTYTLPAYSMVALQFNEHGRILRSESYSYQHWQEQQPPQQQVYR